MLGDMFFCRGGEDFVGGTPDVRCESSKNGDAAKCYDSTELDGAMPTDVPTSSWRRAEASQWMRDAP